MNEQVSAWLGSIDGMPDACERLQRVVLLKEECLWFNYDLLQVKAI